MFRIAKYFRVRGAIAAVVVLGLVYALSFAAMAGTQGAQRLDISVRGMVSLRLYVFDCGHIVARDLSIFNPLIAKGTQKELANACYLLKHPKGMLLWDAGLADDLLGKKGGMEVMDGAFNMSVTRTLASQLKAIGVRPSEIDFLALSHMHNDHTLHARSYPRTSILVCRSAQDRAGYPLRRFVSLSRKPR